jgi:hypothetical protein
MLAAMHLASIDDAETGSIADRDGFPFQLVWRDFGGNSTAIEGAFDGSPRQLYCRLLQ